jgi:phage repressor protein C with HTH and peptisase S24 domain
MRGLTTVLVTGESMLPALRPGDRLIVRRGAPIRAGDLVVARLPPPRSGPEPPAEGRSPATLIVKRAFRRTPGGWWLESDNQAAPGRRDSWDFGAVPERDIAGRVVGRYWPLSRLSPALSAWPRRPSRWRSR